MKTTEYLYGSSKPLPVPQEVIDHRVKLLNKELTEEQAKHYFERDISRVHQIVKAVKFWETINDN